MASTHNTPDRPDFVRQQYALTAHIRNPEHVPPPEGIEARRIKIYSELFYNNVESFIANTYPVLRSILSEQHWHAMIRDYFSRHLSHTPLFPEMPREFLKYLENERESHPDDPAFMLELAHYEWVELALSIMEDHIDETFDPEIDVLKGLPICSPVAWSLNYHYPVHKISPDFQPEAKDGTLTHLIVFRDSADDIHFMEINAVTAQLMQLIENNNDQTGLALIQRIAETFDSLQREAVMKGGAEILYDLKQRSVILGARTLEER